MTSRARIVTASIALAILALACGALIYYRASEDDAADRLASRAPAAELPSLDEAAGWLNGGPLTRDSLAGHPVAFVRWSDTDPRCLDALPEIESLHQAYARYGVRIVGVYAPDFTFGADRSVPERLAKRLGLAFTIALDPEYRIAMPRAAAPPSIVVADTAGRIVLRADGERLAEVDRALRDQVRALNPAVNFPGGSSASSTPTTTPARAIRFAFLGASRVTEGPLKGASSGVTLTYTAQFRYEQEGGPFVPFPVGRWTPSAEGITAARGGPPNYLAFRYPAGSVDVVMAPPASGPTRVWVLADDGWLGPDERGDDVRADARGGSYVDVAEPRLYSVVRGASGHVLKLSPRDPGVTFYLATFESAVSSGSR